MKKYLERASGEMSIKEMRLIYKNLGVISNIEEAKKIIKDLIDDSVSRLCRSDLEKVLKLLDIEVKE